MDHNKRRLMLMLVLFFLINVVSVARGAAVRHEMRSTTALTSLAAAILSSAATDHTITVFSGNYTDTFTCALCINKSLSFVGVSPASTVRGLGFHISQAHDVSFSGQATLPITIKESHRLALARVHMLDISVQSAVIAQNVSDVVINHCTFNSLTVFSVAIDIAVADRVAVTELSVYSSSFLTAGLSVQNVTGDVSVVNATFIYTQGTQLKLAACGGRTEVVGCAFLVGRGIDATDTAISARDLPELNVVDSTFLYNEAAFASVMLVQDSELFVSRSKFLANGNPAALDTYLVYVLRSRVVIVDSDMSINWGGLLGFNLLRAGSRIDSSTLDVNFNPPNWAMLSVSQCDGDLIITNSSISHNIGGALHTQACHVEMKNSLVWGQSTFGALCGTQGSIDATHSSIYRNGYKRQNFANQYRDLTCLSCLGFSISSNPDVCTNATFIPANATDIAAGGLVACEQGVDMCGRCNATGPLDCGDCNGRPFGLATVEECEALNKLGVSGAEASFNFTSPHCLLQPKDDDGQPFPGASLEVRYDAIKVYYYNTTSQQDQAQFVFAINDTQYLRTRPTALCVRYDRLVDNGASFVLQQCLYREKAEVIFNQRVLAIPKDFQKVTINMAGLQSFDNQTRERHPELDVATRRVEVEISLRLSQAAVTRTSSGQAETLGDIAVPGSSRVDSVSFASSNFSLSMAVPNFAVFSTSEGAAFNYTLEPMADAYGLVLKFGGTFDTVNYDPHFGILLPGGEDGGGGDDVLVKVLVPVLVGVALLVVVVVIVAAVAIGLWKRHRDLRSSAGMVNFSPSEADSQL